MDWGPFFLRSHPFNAQARRVTTKVEGANSGREKESTWSGVPHGRQHVTREEGNEGAVVADGGKG